MSVELERPSVRRAAEFLSAARRSYPLHKNLVTPPSTLERYRAYLKYSRRAEQEHFFIIAEASGELAGVINIGAIVRGYFNSAPIGYYAFLPHAGKGLMRAGLGHAISYAFRRAKLHRLEANIQPGNLRSIALVRGLGFRNEGFSPKFLKISGKWRDHQRWALLVEEWRG